MRYCMSFYLNWHRNQEGSKSKATYLLNKKLTFNFNHSQFLCQLRQKLIQYLISKQQSMPKLSSEGYSVKMGIVILLCTLLYTVKYTVSNSYSSRKYPLWGYVPSPSRVAKENKLKERENSEIKQFFGPVELWIMVTDKGNG